MKEGIHSHNKDRCWYCMTNDCEHMKVIDRLVLVYSDLYNNSLLTNRQNIFTIYKSATRMVHGKLGNRKRACECINKKIGVFPNKDGTARVGYIGIQGKDSDSYSLINLLEQMFLKIVM